MTDSTKRFDDLRTRYAQSLRDKHASLESAWRAFATAPDERALPELQTMVHRLAGSAPAYGYEAIGAAAHVADACFNAWTKRPASDREDAAALAAQLAEPMQALIESLARVIETTPQTD